MTFKNKLFFQTIVLLSLFLFFPQNRQIFAATTITTCEELQAIPDGDTGDYLLGNNINCSSIANFTPIADFGGTFDGQNHTISNLTINYPDNNAGVGLFGVHGQEMSISNLNITNANITGGSGVGCLVGAYSFMNTGGGVTLSNVNCSGSVTGMTMNTGGLVGSMRYINISNSSFTGTVTATGNMNIGGLVGVAVEGISIINSNFDGDIVGGMAVGGIVGGIQCWISSCSNSITNSYSSGTITNVGMNTGGILGGSISSTTIENCHSDISISGDSNVGGIVGSSSGDTITKCYSNSSSIFGTSSNIGGLVGYSNGSNLNKSYSTSTLISSDSQYVGGLVGWLSSGSTINDCYSTSNVTGHYVGGLVGHAETPNISQTYSTGVLTISSDEGDLVGGLIGEVYSNGAVNNSFTISKNSSDIYISLIGSTDPDNLPTTTNSYDALTTDIANFSNYSFAVYDDWNFTDIWSNIETYPTFIWQHSSEPTSTPTPTATPTSGVTQSSNSDSSSSNSFGPPVCTDSKPIKTPDLFQTNALKNNAKLFFTPTDTNQYYVSFSTNINAEGNGELVTLAREGVQSHTIYFLKPNTTYYVKVRSQNGCMPGDWSNIMKFTTNNSVYYKYIKAVSSLVDKFQAKSVSNIKSKSVTPTITQVKGIQTETKTQEIKSEPKKEVASNTNKDTSPKHCFLWWCW